MLLSQGHNHGKLPERALIPGFFRHKACSAHEPEPTGRNGRIKTECHRDMTEYIVNHTGKLLFPGLARDQRKRRLRVILLVAAACLFSAGMLSAWIMCVSINGGHAVLMPDMSFWPR
jgi:hypothetical protein